MNPQRTMQRRAAQQLLKYARSLPQVSLDGALKSGVVTHVIMSHDAGCPAAETYCAFDCTCSPGLSFHKG